MSSTKVFPSQFWNIGGSKRISSISVTGTCHPPAFETGSTNANLSYNKSKQGSSVSQNTALNLSLVACGTHKRGFAQQKRSTSLRQRKLPSTNLPARAKWLGKQPLHKALEKTLFQSHYSALEGVSSGRRNGSWRPSHLWLPIESKTQIKLSQSLATSPTPPQRACSLLTGSLIHLLTDS